MEVNRGEVAIVVGVLLCSIGAGLFHPGLGLLVAGVGAAAFGGLSIIGTPDEPEESA